jgi:hypothetical protein
MNIQPRYIDTNSVSQQEQPETAAVPNTEMFNDFQHGEENSPPATPAFDHDEITEVICNELPPMCEFIDELQNHHQKEYFEFAIRIFNQFLKYRLSLNVPLRNLQMIVLDNLQAFCTLPDLKKLNQNMKIFDDITRFVKSNHIQMTYLNQLSTYIAPESLVINGQVVGQKISIKRTTHMLLRLNSRIIESILKEREFDWTAPVALINSEMSSSIQRSKSAGTLRFRFGADDFTITSRNMSHNYLVVYFTLANIPPKFRLKRSDVYPIYIVRRSDMKSGGIGINDIWQDLNTEFASMCETGIDIKVNISGTETENNIKASFLAMCGDNKGSYEFGGWSSHFGVGFICRYCGATGAQVQSSEVLPLFDAKDLNDYNQMIHSSHQNLQPNRFGLKQPCALSRFGNIFHLFPEDPLHDLAEGEVKRIMTRWILNCVDLSRQEIIDKVKNFEFFHGKIPISYYQGKFRMSGAKAVQVCNLFHNATQINQPFLFSALNFYRGSMKCSPTRSDMNLSSLNCIHY